jgi:predicted transcriptional regulator
MNSLHIPIHKTLHDELLKVAKSQRTTKTEVARRALEAYIRDYDRQKTFEDMQRYAEEMAEHSGEFVKETDKAVSKQLLSSTDW